MMPATDESPQDKTFGNRLYYQRFDAALGQPMKVELVYDVDVHEATVEAAKQLISTSADVPAEEFAPYLRETSMIPIKGKISDLAGTMHLPAGQPLRGPRCLRPSRQHHDLQLPGTGCGQGQRGLGLRQQDWRLHRFSFGLHRRLPLARNSRGSRIRPASAAGKVRGRRQVLPLLGAVLGKGRGLDSHRRLARTSFPRIASTTSARSAAPGSRWLMAAT